MVGWTIRSSTAPAPAAVHGLAATKDASDPFSRALLPEVDVGISSVFIEGEETCLQAIGRLFLCLRLRTARGESRPAQGARAAVTAETRLRWTGR